MSSIQMIFAIGAFFILTLVIVNVNKTILMTEEVMLDSNLGIQAISLASSVIEEANKLSFDNLTDTATVYNESELTQSSNFGCEGIENPKDLKSFNDFDDFHGFSIIDSTMPSSHFLISCEVNYINPANPDQTSISPTWYKKLTVRVSSESMIDTVVTSTIYSYWIFI